MIGTSRLCAYQPGQSTHGPPCQHVGLPMRLVLDAPGADVERQQHQRIRGRIVASVLQDVRRDERGGDRRLPAGKAVVRAVLEPEARIVPGARARAREDVLAGRRRNAGDDLGVDALPHRFAEARCRSPPTPLRRSPPPSTRRRVRGRHSGFQTPEASYAHSVIDCATIRSSGPRPAARRRKAMRKAAILNDSIASVLSPRNIRDRNPGTVVLRTRERTRVAFRSAECKLTI